MLPVSGVLVVHVPGRYVVGSHIFQKVKTPPGGGKVRWGKGGGERERERERGRAEPVGKEEEKEEESIGVSLLW